MKLTFLFLIFILVAEGIVNAQECPDNYVPKVYIDCSNCDQNFIRTEIHFVHYVRDRNDADIYILITSLSTGSGGNEYTIEFIGYGPYFTGINDKQKMYTERTSSDDDIRKELVRIIKVGLVPYLLRTTQIKHLSLEFNKKDEKVEELEDPWDFWVFTLGFDTNINGEKSKKHYDLQGYVNIDRVTPELRVDFDTYYNFSKDSFTVDDETIESEYNEKGARTNIIKSISDHWSYGSFLGASSSSYENKDLELDAYIVAFEYDIFPYCEANRKQLRLIYAAGPRYFNYREFTIYNETSEILFHETAIVALGLKQPWGNINVSLEGSNYLNDIDKNRLTINKGLNLKVFKGLSFNISGNLSVINDQINLAQEEVSTEEILLKQRELATSYKYSVYLGFSYTFGSSYNNVVNPRFGY